MSKYPVINAGTTPVVTVLNEMLPDIAVKSSATPRTSTTTLAADPHLVLSLEANAVYDFDLDLNYNGGTNGSSDLKFGFTGPSGFTMTFGALVVAIPAGVASVGGTQGTVTTSGTVGTGTPLYARVSGVVTTSATPGSLTLTWAQNTSSGTATTLTTGCKMRVKRQA
jgi:hypothetical protein